MTADKHISHKRTVCAWHTDHIAQMKTKIKYGFVEEPKVLCNTV